MTFILKQKYQGTQLHKMSFLCDTTQFFLPCSLNCVIETISKGYSWGEGGVEL